MRLGELGVLAILTLIVLMTVVRPLVRQVLAPPPRWRPPRPAG